MTFYTSGDWHIDPDRDITFDVYEFYEIKKDLSEEKPIVENSELPERALIILGIIFGIVVLVGLKLRKNY